MNMRGHCPGSGAGGEGPGAAAPLTPIPHTGRCCTLPAEHDDHRAHPLGHTKRHSGEGGEEIQAGGADAFLVGKLGALGVVLKVQEAVRVGAEGSLGHTPLLRRRRGKMGTEGCGKRAGNI